MTKILVLRKGVNGPLLGPKSVFLNFSLKSIYWIFLKLYLMTDMKNRVKVTVLDFLLPKWGKWVIFGFKINSSELLFKLVHRTIHWKLYLITGIKNWFKVTVLIFYRKFLLSPKLGKLRHFWFQNQLISFL